jgi:hypothetical protein
VEAEGSIPSTPTQKFKYLGETWSSVKPVILVTSHTGDPVGRLREYWQTLFEKDALVGFLADNDPRDLVVVYRKLTLAHLRGDEATYGAAPRDSTLVVGWSGAKPSGSE